MKEKIIEVIERLKDTPYKKGDFILTHSWVVQVATEVEHLVNQEVERRIKERMPSEEEINLYADWHSRKYEDDATQKSIAFTACRRAIKWLRSRLTNPDNNLKQNSNGSRN